MRYLGYLFGLAGSAYSHLSAQDPASPNIVPSAASEADFEALRKTSPFTRVLSFPETYALRGVAMVDNIQVATLYNRETKQTLVVTPDGKNEAGISLVGVVPSATLEGVSARISFAGDEAELKYELSQIAPTPKVASNAPGASGPRDGNSGGTEPRGPSPQDLERYKALPEEKQVKLREYIGHVMRNYPDMPREERGNLIRGAMIRLTDGRDIEMPPAPNGGQNPAPVQGTNPSSGGGSNSGRDERGGDRGRDGDRGERR